MGCIEGNLVRSPETPPGAGRYTEDILARAEAAAAKMAKIQHELRTSRNKQSLTNSFLSFVRYDLSFDMQQ